MVLAEARDFHMEVAGSLNSGLNEGAFLLLQCPTKKHNAEQATVGACNPDPLAGGAHQAHAI